VWDIPRTELSRKFHLWDIPRTELRRKFHLWEIPGTELSSQFHLWDIFRTELRRKFQLWDIPRTELSRKFHFFLNSNLQSSVKEIFLQIRKQTMYHVTFLRNYSLDSVFKLRFQRPRPNDLNQDCV
jgi:hypothetical protein